MNPRTPSGDGLRLSRRQVLIGTAGSAVTAALASTEFAQAAQDASTGSADAPASSHVAFTLNGRRYSLDVDNRTTLLDVLRERLHLTGTKKGCDHGQCGACTVIVEGRRINACLTLAVMHEGDTITTIEGLGTPERLHPMQSAFVKHDGYQCGYCTPGQICSAVAMLDEIKAGIPSHVTQDLSAPLIASTAEMRERMSGNICRCGAYSNIIEAIEEVAGASA
ncbi:aldehyde dehydrogenase iron-sulfur subunit PaoA [Pseudomonas viridiflava]|uniref:aldehyde dehydrogenase iron-sulfur subunit PaoA n=1 Tax=Pseudomonas viridiflava TaxID=33069 RepID=UPI002A6A3139|nr:aldehyde dehydrogenase iron-sulfur subunit PaoA [Pseudomonas viridiflava]MDY0935107.1 aldehyde dehydrogenase iron-sulfur subunit PaoA [Pseudomonas viridiflava]MDY1011931.1 aldehyde dehydrogenase iron-sulfur subunit PaoA [Pseudomonas viridiflava]